MSVSGVTCEVSCAAVTINPDVKLGELPAPVLVPYNAEMQKSVSSLSSHGACDLRG